MPAGDLTEIGEKGINLSGGQKARVCLARAVYKRPNVILMDDPISALDSHTRKQIFKDVFQGILKDSTRVLVTHAVDFVHLADKIIIMDQGKITAQGTYEDLKNNEYMIHIKDIHQKNKDELKKANQKASEELQKVCENFVPQEKTESSSDSDSKPDLLSDEQIQQKLKVFEGAKAELDEKTSKIVGRLLQDENEEQICADATTYSKLLKMTGVGVFAFLITTITILKFMDNYSQSLMQNWANASPEDQFEHFYDYMKTILCTSYLLLITR